MRATAVTFAGLFAAFASSCVGGTTVCPGGGHGGDLRCDGAKVEWCSVSGGGSEGDLVNSGTNTAEWKMMDECTAPSTCMMLASAGAPAQPFCVLSTSPVATCAGPDHPDCLDGVPIGCTAGFPTVGPNLVPCFHACVQGVCALSSTVDPQCPAGAPSPSPYAPSWYCSESGFVACQSGLDLDPLYYGLGAGPVGQTCPVDIDAGSDDGGGFDAGSDDAAGLDAGGSTDAAISP